MSHKDKDLHDEKISGLYQQLPDVQPSEDSDALIRASARRAVHSAPQKKNLSFGLKQFTATAAVLMLSIGLLVQWQRHEPSKLEEALGRRDVASAPSLIPAPAPANDSMPIENSRADAATPERHSHADALTSAAGDAAGKYVKSDVEKYGREYKKRAESTATPVMAFPAPAPAAVPELASPMASATAENRMETDNRPDSNAAAQAALASHAREKMLKQESEKQTARETRMDSAVSVQSAGIMGRLPAQKPELAAKAAAPRVTPGATPLPTSEPTSAPTSLAMPMDYRRAMSSGDYAQALAALQNVTGATITTDAARVVDRDMLRRLLGSREKPECLLLSAEMPGEEKRLCDFLNQMAQEKKTSTVKSKNAENLLLLNSENTYRRRAIEALINQ